MTVVVGDLVHKVAAWLHAVEDERFLVARGHELVFSVSLHDGAE